MALNVEKVKPAVGVADEPDYGHCVATIGRLGMEVDDMKVKLVSMELNHFLHSGREKTNLIYITSYTLSESPDI